MGNEILCYYHTFLTVLAIWKPCMILYRRVFKSLFLFRPFLKDALKCHSQTVKCYFGKVHVSMCQNWKIWKARYVNHEQHLFIDKTGGWTLKEQTEKDFTLPPLNSIWWTLKTVSPSPPPPLPYSLPSHCTTITVHLCFFDHIWLTQFICLKCTNWCLLLKFIFTKFVAQR